MEGKHLCQVAHGLPFLKRALRIMSTFEEHSCATQEIPSKENCISYVREHTHDVPLVFSCYRTSKQILKKIVRTLVYKISK